MIVFARVLLLVSVTSLSFSADSTAQVKGFQNEDDDTRGISLAFKQTESNLPAVFGNYYALIIGNDDYQNLPDLRATVIDNRKISQNLEVFLFSGAFS